MTHFVPELGKLSWLVYTITTDHHSALTHLIERGATGQVILHMTQGKVCAVEWREKIKDPKIAESS